MCHFCPQQHLPAAIDLSPIKYVLNWRDDGMRERLIAGGWGGGATGGGNPFGYSRVILK